MMKYIRTAAVLFLLACMLTGCGCQHEWQEATCLTPKTCTLCQETQGEADGAHTPGDWEETVDYIHGKREGIRHCSLCHAVTDAKEEDVQTLTAQELFVVTPLEFTDRMAFLAEQRDMTFRYSIDMDQDILWIFADINEAEVMLQFFHPDTSPMTVEEAESTGIWCVSFSMAGPANQFGSLIDKEIFELFVLACDPGLDQEGLQEAWIMKGVAAANSANLGEFFGYHEKNGLLYEFGHVIYEAGENSVCVENIQMYASDFR